jgi:hypothetical protein
VVKSFPEQAIKTTRTGLIDSLASDHHAFDLDLAIRHRNLSDHANDGIVAFVDSDAAALTSNAYVAKPYSPRTQRR